MKKLVLAAAGGFAALSLATTAFAQGPTEKVRKLNLYSWPQAALPQSYQAAQLIAQQWRQLGLAVEVKPLQRQQQTQLIWFSRDKWDVTMWRMVGRPERSDPDEFLYSLYHSSYAEKGYNFIGYLNPEYDKLAEKQRTQLDREERPYLTDFGVAVREEDLVHERGRLSGTLPYMGPEQVRGEGHRIDGRTDIYSLGVLLYEMLCGNAPFAANSDYDLMQKQIGERPVRLLGRVPDLDAKVESALMRALAKKPEERFASVRAFSDELGATALRLDAPKIVLDGTRLIGRPPIEIAQPKSRTGKR